MYSEHIQRFEFDVRNQRVGANIGGDCGAVVSCPKCGEPSCLFTSRVLKSGKNLKRYGHRVVFTSGPASKPEAEWTDVCETSEAQS